MSHTGCCHNLIRRESEIFMKIFMAGGHCRAGGRGDENNRLIRQLLLNVQRKINWTCDVFMEKFDPVVGRKFDPGHASHLVDNLRGTRAGRCSRNGGSIPPAPDESVRGRDRLVRAQARSGLGQSMGRTRTVAHRPTCESSLGFM